MAKKKAAKKTTAKKKSKSKTKKPQMILHAFPIHDETGTYVGEGFTTKEILEKLGESVKFQAMACGTQVDPNQMKLDLADKEKTDASKN